MSRVTDQLAFIQKAIKVLIDEKEPNENVDAQLAVALMQTSALIGAHLKAPK